MLAKYMHLKNRNMQCLCWPPRQKYKTTKDITTQIN